jgi:hypothetical protein
MAGHAPVDGLLLGSARPFRLPGFLDVLGRMTAHFFLSPNISTPTTDNAWLNSMGLSLEPHPAVTLGASRTIRFAGEGISDNPSLSELFTIFSGQGGDDSFDDSQGELSLRVRFRAWGQPMSPYVSLGFEDLPSMWEDPGLVAGLLVPIDVGTGVLAARYEYQAFGQQAQWCGGCEYVSHRWYTQREYGEYVLDGVPLGSTLGGYGSRHQLGLTWWSHESYRVSGVAFTEEREEGNLLYDRWPGRRSGFGGSVAGRPRPGWEIEAGGLVSFGEDATDGGLNLTVRVFDLLSNPAGLAR